MTLLGLDPGTNCGWAIQQADAISIPLPDDAVDMTFTSPPYGSQRTYGIGFVKSDAASWSVFGRRGASGHGWSKATSATIGSALCPRC